MSPNGVFVLLQVIFQSSSPSTTEAHSLCFSLLLHVVAFHHAIISFTNAAIIEPSWHHTSIMIQHRKLMMSQWWWASQWDPGPNFWKASWKVIHRYIAFFGHCDLKKHWKKHSIRWHIYIPTSTIKFNQIVGKYSLHGMGKFPQTKVYVFTTWRRSKKTKLSRNTEPKRIRAVSDGEVPQRRVDIWGSIPSHAWRSSLGWGWEKDFRKNMEKRDLLRHGRETNPKLWCLASMAYERQECGKIWNSQVTVTSSKLWKSGNS